MARQYYKDSTTGQMKPIGVKVEDTLPVGTEVDYDGQDIPEGWVEVQDNERLLEAEDTVSLATGVAVNVETASITAPKDGLALAIVHAVFSGAGGGTRYVNIGVISGDITPKANMQIASGNISVGISSMRVVNIKAGNILAPRIEQTSGSAMNVTCRIQLCYL